jgi:5-guanidino-2-oxopentanoate decarboxylase
MKRAELSTGEALVSLLEAYGVDTVFGIPGVHNVEMYRALPRSRIRHILTRHEQGAGFMADGYARVTGKPGICFTITGPGLTNILTPMGQAWSDSVPMLVLSSSLDIADSAQGRGRLHEMISQRGAALSITAAAVTALTPHDVRDAVAEAFARFASQRPRPAYLELPLDLLKVPAGDDWTARKLPSRPVADPAAIADAAILLSRASAPLMLLGGGAVDAGQAALRLAEALEMVILTTISGKGIVPSDHPLCLGTRLSQDKIREALCRADVIIAVGTEISETDLWETKISIPGKLIRIDIDPASLVRPHAAELPILADATAALAALAAAFPERSKLPRHHEARAFVRDHLAGEPAEDDRLRADLRIVLDTIRQALPRETVIASDMTQIAYAANEIFPIDLPRRWLHPAGFGTLGYALPAAIGARAGRPDLPTAVLVGDYGFQYTINELGTAAELGQPLVILLWNNDALGQIRDDMINKGIQPNAVTLKNPDFAAIARAYACAYAKPQKLAEIAPAIAAALAADRPTIIEMTPRMLNT